MSPDLAKLMQKYCDGDRQAFHDLYRATSGPLLGYLVRLSGDRSAAEDLLQVTFLKVHRARSAYVSGANPLPWIYAIAHRTFIDEARRRRRARVRVARDSDHIPEVAVGLRGTSDEAEVRDLELEGAALAALEKLPPTQRQAVTLVKLSGKSIAEAAEIAGTTQGAMKVRAHRGYRALRRALGGGKGGDSGG